ncbi:hypothetical protein BHQ18_09600 [Mycolicibacterium flavescens]|uniref:DUF732 domain-containing protein n=1 Tax=Mycolicibacterium flavescens TaxID=1776 RepID=A0A1E3RLL0_MYCFV|nr:hypothetical protein BHQ18_09600 [Mycolicibacterium flavescens]
MAALALALGVAVPAHADEQSYLTDLADHGFEGEISVALEMGHQICTDVRDGVPEETTVAAIYDHTGDGVTIEDARYVYDAAITHLC